MPAIHRYTTYYQNAQTSISENRGVLCPTNTVCPLVDLKCDALTDIHIKILEQKSTRSSANAEEPCEHTVS